MNEASRWRIELAREIAEVYRPRPGALMSFIGGSVGRGDADTYSDMDMGVYWDQIPSDWLAEPPLPPDKATRFTWHMVVEGKAYVEQYFVGCAKVDIAHLAVDWMEEMIADVVERHDLDGGKQDMLDGTLSAIPLFGDKAFASLQAKITAYPAELGTKMIQENLRFYPPWVLQEQSLDRNELFMFYTILNEMVQHVIGVLAGLNGIYVMVEKLKRVEALAERMPLKPPNFAARVHALFEGEREAVPLALKTLEEDVLTLLETHRPDIDTRRKREILAITIDPCDEKPPF